MARIGLNNRKLKLKTKTRNIKINFKKKYLLIIIPIILIILGYVFTKSIQPTLITLSETKAKSIALKATNKIVNEHLKDIQSEDIIIFQKDENNNITGLKTNVILLNKLSVEIASGIQEELLKIYNSTIRLPLGSIIVPNTILGGSGPILTINIVPIGSVSSEFKTEFVSTGINQTRHRISLNTTSNVSIIAPFVTKTAKFESSILVSETVMMGNVPQSYYYFDNLPPDQSLNMVK